MELVDTPDSKSCEGNLVTVQVRRAAPSNYITYNFKHCSSLLGIISTTMASDKKTNADNSADVTANLIRGKLLSIYGDEPSVVDEEQEIASSGVHSRHQKFMANLMNGGKSLPDIQLAWHEYYQNLDDSEKHEVWQEFYEQQNKTQSPVSSAAANIEEVKPLGPIYQKLEGDEKAKTMADLHKKILHKVSAEGKLKKSHHVKSLVFGIGFASLATGLLFFITNNERFITPFIQPSVNAAASPIITDGGTVGTEARLIIPKINLEAPLVTDVTDNSEEAIQIGLEDGVTLYPDTGKPGELANPTFFGHSSNNLFNKGDYKFVFVRLHQLEIGDTYAINYNGKQYVYRIFSREVVTPDRVDVLYARPREVMSTLITCDPPGTSNNRLVLHAEQISPNPIDNIASTAPVSDERPTEIPSNAPSFLSRLFGL